MFAIHLARRQNADNRESGQWSRIRDPHLPSLAHIDMNRAMVRLAHGNESRRLLYATLERAQEGDSRARGLAGQALARQTQVHHAGRGICRERQ